MAKQGRSISEIAVELERQQKAKRDFIAPVEAITLQPDTETKAVAINGLNGDGYGLTPWAHAQLGEYVGIPKAYYDRTLQAYPALLAESVNTWLGDKRGDKRLVRTLDGNARAWLSNRYRPLDNVELAEAILPTLAEKSVEVISSEITETRFYLKGILPDLSVGLDTLGWAGSGGDAFIAAVIISNSEVGNGTLRVETGYYFSRCTNLSIWPLRDGRAGDTGLRKVHIGRAFDLTEDFTLYTDQTRKQDDLAFFLKVRDVVAAGFSEDFFRERLRSLQGAAEQKIESDDLPRVVEVTVKRLALPDGASKGVLNHLIRGGDLTKFGLAQAITATANTHPDYEAATLLERAGGEIIDLPPSEWKVIAEAA